MQEPKSLTLDDLDVKDRVQLLEQAKARFKHIHDALWKEETHYTWLIYILAAGVIFIFSSELSPFFKFVVVSALSFLGVIVCIIAYNVIWRESQYLDEAIESRKRYMKLLPITYHEAYPESAGNSPDGNIRRLFKLTVLLPIGLFLLIFVLSALQYMYSLIHYRVFSGAFITF